MPATKQIDQDVLDVLTSVEWDGEIARLTSGQLDRKLYVKVNDVLEALGGKWNRKLKGHVFEDAQHDALEAVILTGLYSSPADAKQLFGVFETPPDLALALVSFARLDDLRDKDGESRDLRILEPSVGSGRLLDALNAIRDEYWDDVVVCVELQEERFWPDLEHRLIDELYFGDFLEMDAAKLGEFDVAIMNPPFAKQADIAHVRHAFSLLKPGGQLAAIMSPGFTFRTDKKSRAFKDLVEEFGHWHKNPPGSFKSEGTAVETVMVFLRAD